MALKDKKIRDGLKNEYAGHYFNTMILSIGVTKSQITSLVKQMTSSAEDSPD